MNHPLLKHLPPSRIEVALRQEIDTEEKLRAAQRYLDRIITLMEISFRELIDQESPGEG